MHGIREIRGTSRMRMRSGGLYRDLERLLAVQRKTDKKVWSNIIQKDPSDAYLLWRERVSDIKKQVATFYKQYDEIIERAIFFRGEMPWAITEVDKLLEERPMNVLVDKPPERLRKENCVPSIAEYPTLQKAFQDILALLKSNGVKCVALLGQGTGTTIIMEHLHNHLRDSVDKLFDIVIFIKVATDEQIEDLHILQKIADQVGMDREGDECKVGGRIQRVLEGKRYLLILDGARHTPDGIWEKLDISKDKKDSKVVITTHDHPLALSSKYIDSKVDLQPLSPWMTFRDIVGDKTAKLASPREEESSSKCTTDAGKPILVPHMLKLMRINDFVHLILSYNMRIGYEDFLRRWINIVFHLSFADDDSDFDSLRRRVEYLCDILLTYVPVFITKEIINGGSIITETPLKHVPQSILLLATHLAVRQLTQTLTSDTIQAYGFQNIWFSTRNDAEKRAVVKNMQADSQIGAAFGDLQIIDLNQIDDQIKRELVLLNLATWLGQTTSSKSPTENYKTSRCLVLVVDGDGDKKLDPLKVTLPVSRDSPYVMVFITTLSSNDHLTNNVDLAIKTEDHLLPWEVFCKNVGSEFLHSSTDIQSIAVQIVEKCGSHLLAIILMAKSLKDKKDARIWELALEELCYRDREAIANAFFHVIRANVNSGRAKVHLIMCLMALKPEEWEMRDDQLFDCWISEKLVDTEGEAKGLLRNFVEYSVLLPFEDTLGLHILLPEDIKIILHASGKEITENLSKGALPSTILDLQVLNLSKAHMQNLNDVKSGKLKELHLEGCMLETVPKAVFRLEKLESLSLGHCSQLWELAPQIGQLQNLKTLRLASCEQLRILPREITELKKLETLSLEHCSQLPVLPWKIYELKNLKTLRLAMCEQLKTLPSAYCLPPNLETLSVEYCSPSLELPPEIGRLENLRTLRLAGSEKLSTLPQEIQELQKLETLSLENCSRFELSPQIVNLENLRTLRLAGCEQVRTLPEEMQKLQNLETLSLENCLHLLKLTPQIGKLENLKELKLAGCEKLQQLPQEIWELTHLQTLSLPWPSILPTRENQELINSDYSSGRGKKGVPSSSSTNISVGSRLKLTVHGGFKPFEQLCEKILHLQIQNIKMCDLSGIQIAYLPQFINFPKLISLFLGNNLNLMKIPSSFFDHVPLLTVLNLSCTSIHELPSSIFSLKELREFYLKDCELLLGLPPEIGELSNLTTLDLHGTLITHLPKEIEKLTNLESLSLSFYNDDSSSIMIPFGVLSKLIYLKVLRIGVNSDNQWWFNSIRCILAEIKRLERLRELDMYIPEADSLNTIERCPYNFRFIIGHHKPRMISRVPPVIEEMFKERSPSLKFVNGLHVTSNQVKSILSKASAFFLDRHMKINNLAQFGLKNLKKLRLCILAECNEMKSIIDMDGYGADSDLNESFHMQYLTIFYMNSLRSIVNKPIGDNSIFWELKLLSLHTCPELTTIFTMHSLNSLVNLEELIVEDCPKVSCIISCPSSFKRGTDIFLPRLRKLSLFFVPELASISNGVRIGRKLKEMRLYCCPKLQSLSIAELSSKKLDMIRGETEWWRALKWNIAEWGQEDAPDEFNKIFSAIDENLDIFTQLTFFNTKNDSGDVESSDEESDLEGLGWEWE